LDSDAIYISFISLSVLLLESLLGLSETMDCGGGGGPYVFPLHRCKTIHLVRIIELTFSVNTLYPV